MDIRPLRNAAIRERIPLRSPHHMKTIPIPAATNVARAAIIVPTEIWAVSAEITLDQSDAVTTVVNRLLEFHTKTSYNIFYISPRNRQIPNEE